MDSSGIHLSKVTCFCDCFLLFSGKKTMMATWQASARCASLATSKCHFTSNVWKNDVSTKLFSAAIIRRLRPGYWFVSVSTVQERESIQGGRRRSCPGSRRGTCSWLKSCSRRENRLEFDCLLNFAVEVLIVPNDSCINIIFIYSEILVLHCWFLGVFNLLTKIFLTVFISVWWITFEQFWIFFRNYRRSKTILA